MIALWSGVLAAVTPTVSGLLSPVFGRLADRFGRKLMLIRSLAAFTVIIAAMGLVTSVWQFLVMRFLQGLFAGFSPMAMAVASVSAPRDKVSIAIARVQGAHALGVQIGTAASPLLTGFVAAVTLQGAYLMNGAMALGGAALLFLGARDLLHRRERGEA